MTTVHTFASNEEAELMMRAEEQLALSQALPEQRAITGGDYWMRLSNDVVIFGYVYTFTEAKIQELEGGVSKRVAAQQDKDLRLAHDRGYRYGKCYSLDCLSGEIGSTHVVDMMKISKGDFLYARVFNWDFHSMWRDDDPCVRELARKWDAMVMKLAAR